MSDDTDTTATNWTEAEEEQDDYSLREYDITASPNDFNILTLFSFIESGAVKIPGFQRNYVWDIKRASRLIESLLIGLPIPQIFLYEEDKNRFLVIDGQQRLMSIYYFIKQRFPREEKRSELRQVFDQHGGIPPNFLEDDKYFTKFNLRLSDPVAGRKNRMNGLNYETLADLKTAFDLRTVRNVIIKQNSPDDGDSSIYEVFNRLNSGGINLTAQEIRISLYHSRFYDMLYRLNLSAEWRRLVGVVQPDLHMKDVEILLRGFAMMMEGDFYTPSMKRFLNVFSKKARPLFGVSAGSSNRIVENEETAARQSAQLQRLDKAVKRQFHTFFNWEDKKAGPFFTLLGEELGGRLKADCAKSPCKEQVDAFLEVGHLRNRLVHQNYAKFLLDKSADEIRQLCENADRFVAQVEGLLIPNPAESQT